MRYHYRCSKCQARTVFKHMLDWYIKPKKCKSCRYIRFYIDNGRQRREDYCLCEGYHYTHRRKSKYCVFNPQYEVNVRVMRYGEDLAAVLEDIKLRAECPF